jgi:hypothetical protein
VAGATGISAPPYGVIALAALHGPEAETLRLVDANMGPLESRGEGLGVTLTHWALGMLYNGLGRSDDAVDAAAPAIVGTRPLGVSLWARIELIEVAARSGDHGLATHALDGLTERAGGSDWALGVDARSRAMLSEGDTAEAAYLEAIERFGAAASPRSSHARTSSTASGCGARGGASTRASSSASPTRC